MQDRILFNIQACNEVISTVQSVSSCWAGTLKVLSGGNVNNNFLSDKAFVDSNEKGGGGGGSTDIFKNMIFW